MASNWRGWLGAVDSHRRLAREAAVCLRNLAHDCTSSFTVSDSLMSQATDMYH